VLNKGIKPIKEPKNWLVAFVFDGPTILDQKQLEEIGFVYKGIGSYYG
jgi:hypothetical protein